jgi:hypothetical protein
MKFFLPSSASVRRERNARRDRDFFRARSDIRACEEFFGT